MLVKRDAFLLANSLEDLTGKTIAQKVFGIGVVGMAISTIIILMLINGFTICEMVGQPSEGILYRLGSFLPGIYDRFFFRRVHRWYFNAESLTNAASAAGFALERVRFYQRYDLSNALLWMRDERPTGIGKEPLLKDLDPLYKQILEARGIADYVFVFLRRAAR